VFSQQIFIPVSKFFTPLGSDSAGCLSTHLSCMPPALQESFNAAGMFQQCVNEEFILQSPFSFRQSFKTKIKWMVWRFLCWLAKKL